MNKNEILKALCSLGFMPEEVEGFGYSIDYENLTIYIPVDEEDADSKCLTLLAPGIFVITKENRQAVLEAMVKLCGCFKYVQPVLMFDDQVGINYQHFLGDNEVSETILEHMINVVAFATVKFHNILNED